MHVYFNLTRKNWSTMVRRRVIGHAESLALGQVTFRVSEASRQRVIRTKRKTVHAFVVGERIDTAIAGEQIRVSYNPYKAGTFVRCDTGAAISTADWVVLGANRQVFAINPQ